MKRILNKGIIIIIFEKYIKQTIKDFDDGVMTLEGDKSYIKRISNDFLNELEMFENR